MIASFFGTSLISKSDVESSAFSLPLMMLFKLWLPVAIIMYFDLYSSSFTIIVFLSFSLALPLIRSILAFLSKKLIPLDSSFTTLSFLSFAFEKSKL